MLILTMFKKLLKISPEQIYEKINFCRICKENSFSGSAIEGPFNEGFLDISGIRTLTIF